MRNITPYKINNAKTYFVNLDSMVGIAENVFILDIPAPETSDTDYINDRLLYNAGIAFFVDPVMGLVAMPFKPRGKMNYKNRPIDIQCYGNNGYKSKILTPDEYVIMYDNTLRKSIYPVIQYYASRMSESMRTADININQQKTPRIFKTTTGSEHALKTMFRNIDTNEEAQFVSKDFDLADIQTVLTPAPFVADKIDTHADKIWNEFCRFVGIGNITESKRERLIRDEVNALQAGAIASRFSRYLPRARAIKEINEKFSGYMDGVASVRYFDTEPSTEDPDGDYIDTELEEGGGEDVRLSV